jgi:hypothetical protein
MKENKNHTYRKRLHNNRMNYRSVIERFMFTIFSFHIIDLFQSSKTLSEKLPIRFANIRV